MGLQVRLLVLIFGWVQVQAYHPGPPEASDVAQANSDCFSLYDGKPMLQLRPLKPEMLEPMRSMVIDLGCSQLGGARQPWLLVACDAIGAITLLAKYDGQVEMLRSDTGAHYRQHSGCAKPHVSSETSQKDIFYDDWRSYEDRLKRVADTVRHSGGTATMDVIGETIEGRSIKAVRFVGPADKGRRTRVVVNFQQHAREWIAGMAGVYAVEQAVAMSLQAPSWLHDMELVLVPLSNPDGFIYSETVDRWWRKNRRTVAGKEWCMGIDLNRNWSPDWAGPHSTSGNPCSEVYFGEAAYSEPEVQALKGLLDEAPVSVHLDIHSYSELIIRPWSYTNDLHPLQDKMDVVGHMMQTAMANSTGKSYTYGGSEIIYPASGVMPDYSTATGAFGFTIELRPGEGEPGGFAPPAFEIKPAAVECWAAICAAISWAGKRSVEKPEWPLPQPSTRPPSTSLAPEDQFSDALGSTVVIALLAVSVIGTIVGFSRCTGFGRFAQQRQLHTPRQRAATDTELGSGITS